jgi:FlaA1/EpsC-like NDP-sugar epimerase
MHMTTITARAFPPAPGVPLALRAVRTVLIGTPETVRQAREQLALAPGAPEPLGCILTDGRQPRAAGGLPVFGTIDDLPAAAARQHFSLAIVSLPMAMTETIERIRAALRRLGIAERFIPPIQDLLAHEPPFAVGMAVQTGASGTAGSRLDLAMLIGRTPRDLDRASVSRILAGKRVLITGAGGSIGSELARIVAEFEPAELQLVERAENPLFEIDRQVGRRWPRLPRRAVLHDVVDSEQTLRLLVELKPQVVFHAAAHKHVPLMEDHPAHAVDNNLFGTRSIADAALAVGAERFVMVSTDKAVNPTSVMGATKRLGEMYIQWLHESSRRFVGTGGSGAAGTSFSIVRFGNVLGSACSVLTIWSAQLAEGGPITVTDPRMTRYFMTIHEAAALVIQAAAIDHGDSAPVHVLDMGEPVSILELARRFAHAHGFAPRVVSDRAGHETDSSVQERVLPRIDIVCTGTRPGEKLHEELAYASEHLRPTPYEGIRAWAGAAGTREPWGNCAAMIADLSAVRSSRDRAAVLEAIRRHVPEMRGTEGPQR